MSKPGSRIVTSLFGVMTAAALVVVILHSLSRSLFPGGMDPGLTGEEPAVPEGAFCVMTCNIAHGRGGAFHQILVRTGTIRRNLRCLAAYVNAVSPDVAGFQEVDIDCSWSGNFNQAEFLAGKTGYPHCRFGVNNVNEGRFRFNYGNAVLSTRPVVAFENHPFGSASLGEKGFLLADVELGGGVVTFAVAHLDYRTAKNRRRQVEKMIEILGDVENPLIVMGDFNCDLTGPEDSLRLLVAALELKTWPFPEGRGATFPAGNPKTRIDYILISDELEFVACVSPAKLLTDHLPVIAVVKLKAP